MRLRTILLLTLGLFTVVFSAHASSDRTGIIRTIDLANQYIVIDAQRYPINEHTEIVNLTGSSNSLQALRTGYPVAFSAEHGRLEKITIYPTDPAERRRLGYRSETDFSQ